jgi:arylsulfatase A-like enzyme
MLPRVRASKVLIPPIVALWAAVACGARDEASPPGVTRLEHLLDPSQFGQTAAGGRPVLVEIENWASASAALRRDNPELGIVTAPDSMRVTKPAGVGGRLSIRVPAFARGAWASLAMRMNAPRPMNVTVTIGGQPYLTSLPGHETVVFFDASRLTAGNPSELIEAVDVDLGPAPESRQLVISRLVVLSNAARYGRSIGVDAALKDDEARQTIYLRGGSRFILPIRRFQKGDRLKFAASALRAGTAELKVSMRSPNGDLLHQWDVRPVSGTTWSAYDLDVGSVSGAPAQLTVEAIGPASSVAFMANARIVPARMRSAPVIVYLIDALRADRLGSYGYEKATTPFLDEFAASAVRFENAYTNGPNTRLSVASLMTSNYAASLFPSLFADAWAASISINYPRLAEVFQKSGYATGGFILNGNAGSPGNLQQGYDVLSLVRRGYEKYNEEQSLLPKIGKWLGEVQSEQFFLYVHTLSVHGPWSSPPEFDHFYQAAANETVLPADLALLDPPGSVSVTRERRISRYDAAVRYADHVFGTFVANLRQMGLYEDAVILVIADHGDQLGEEGRWSHFVGTKLTRSLLHIPMLLKLPGQAPVVVPENVQLIDVFPTLCEVAALDCRDVQVEGRSMLPLVKGDRAAAAEFDRRPVFTEENGLSAFVSRYHWLDSGEVYDVRADPDETKRIQLPEPLASALRREVDGYRARTSKMFKTVGTSNFDDRMSRWVGASGKSVIDPAVQDQLRTLGYIR